MPISTRPDHEEPALRSRTYAGDFRRVFEAAETALSELSRARIHERSMERGVLVAVTPGALGRTGVVKLVLVELETGEVQVDGEAASTIPLFGSNRRALVEALERLDRLLDGAR